MPSGRTVQRTSVRPQNVSFKCNYSRKQSTTIQYNKQALDNIQYFRADI